MASVPSGWLHVLEQYWWLISFTLPFCCNSSFSLHQFQFLHTAGTKQRVKGSFYLWYSTWSQQTTSPSYRLNRDYSLYKNQHGFSVEALYFLLTRTEEWVNIYGKRIKEKGIRKMTWTFNSFWRNSLECWDVWIEIAKLGVYFVYVTIFL